MCAWCRVLSKQPEVQQQAFPGPQWESPFLAIFGFDFGWVVPICTVNYVSKYVLNTLVLPVCLLYPRECLNTLAHLSLAWVPMEEQPCLPLSHTPMRNGYGD